jgi:hypothetical protein
MMTIHVRNAAGHWQSDLKQDAQGCLDTVDLDIADEQHPHCDVVVAVEVAVVVATALTVVVVEVTVGRGLQEALVVPGEDLVVAADSTVHSHSHPVVLPHDHSIGQILKRLLGVPLSVLAFDDAGHQTCVRARDLDTILW